MVNNTMYLTFTVLKKEKDTQIEIQVTSNSKHKNMVTSIWKLQRQVTMENIRQTEKYSKTG